jgi:hypothetical protein
VLRVVVVDGWMDVCDVMDWDGYIWTSAGVVA